MSILNIKRHHSYFVRQVEAYRKSLKNAVCYCWHMQQRGLKAPDTLHIRRLLCETSRYFQMNDDLLRYSYQRLRDANHEITPMLFKETG